MRGVIPPLLTACLLVAYKGTGLPSCTFSESIRSAHINTRSCLLWAAEVLCHDSEHLCCYRSHPHGCRVGHQLWNPECHSGVVWEGRDKRQGGKFTLAPLMLWSWEDRLMWRLHWGTCGRLPDFSVLFVDLHYHGNAHVKYDSHRCTVYFVKPLQLLTNKCTHITFT